MEDIDKEVYENKDRGAEILKFMDRRLEEFKRSIDAELKSKTVESTLMENGFKRIDYNNMNSK
ncbi:MAG: hypothetical protein JXR69_04810 [Candidatus Delongbacteria bacterium]|nr:hypothetical protein [Candidatus Delongbacteria bacterium]